MWKSIFCGGILMCLFNCANAQEYILQKLNSTISSPEYDEIAPCVSKNGKTIYFTRLAYPKFEKTLVESGNNLSETLAPLDYFQRLRNIYSALGGENIKDPVSSSFNQDIWIAHSSANEFDILEHPTYPLNNALPNSVCALSPNDEPIIVNQFAPDGGMQKGFSKVLKSNEGKWQFPEPVGVDRYHNSGSDVNLTMSDDGKVMIISMEREDGYGRSDLFICFKKSDGSWTYPENMGRGVNSPFRESTPHLSKDGKTLYFSSDRTYPGRGCDIYMQERLSGDWKTWSSPRKFRSPINSDGDDSHPYFNEATGFLYFTSDRDGTFDIFRIQIKEKEKLTTPVTEELVENKETEVPFTVGSRIEFSRIFFAQSEALILNKSYPALHKLSVIMNNNPNLVILISGHTDNVGDKELLKKLSLERAEAIKGFLVKKKNIDPARIKTIGRGCSVPLNDNSSEILRRHNRRVEVEVLSNKSATEKLGSR